jgi:hypothetical protein
MGWSPVQGALPIVYRIRINLCYDRRSVGQSVLVLSTHLGLRPDFYLSDSCGLVDVGCPLWREDGCLLQCTELDCRLCPSYNPSERTAQKHILLLLRACTAAVYRIVVQKWVPYIRPSRSHCIATVIHATYFFWNSSAGEYQQQFGGPTGRFRTIVRPLSTEGDTDTERSRGRTYMLQVGFESTIQIWRVLRERAP